MELDVSSIVEMDTIFIHSRSATPIQFLTKTSQCTVNVYHAMSTVLLAPIHQQIVLVVLKVRDCTSTLAWKNALMQHSTEMEHV